MRLCANWFEWGADTPNPLNVIGDDEWPDTQSCPDFTWETDGSSLEIISTITAFQHQGQIVLDAIHPHEDKENGIKKSEET